MSVSLSICIPTYNRSECLSECLQSVLMSVAGHERDIEILISDNASNDDTKDIVRAFQKTNPWILYHRNDQNIGAERNFYLLATLAQGDNIWIFGDDDKMEVGAVGAVLESIRAGYNLTVCNYSLWDKQFIVQHKMYGLSGNRNDSIEDSNELLARFGLHLGYISTVVIKRNLFLKLPIEEYEPFVEYGFPFLYSVYTGMSNGACKARFIVTPLVLNRSDNSGNFDWYKYFAKGSALIFDKLLTKGYSQNAITASKNKVLKEFIVPNIIHLKFLGNGNEIRKNIGMLFEYYKKHWFFWVVCVPVFLTPSSMIRFVKRYVKHIISVVQR